MHTIELVETLKTELQDHFKNKEFQQRGYIEEGELVKFKEPKIYTGWYTEKESYAYEDAEDDFPQILISPVADVSTLDYDRVQVFFVCGSYSDDPDGWIPLSIMANHIKYYLKSNYRVGDKFPIDLKQPVTITYPDMQPRPQWYGTIEAYFYIPRIEETSSILDAFREEDQYGRR